MMQATAIAAAIGSVFLAVPAAAQQQVQPELAPIDWGAAQRDAITEGTEPIRSGAAPTAGLVQRFTPDQLQEAEVLQIPLLMPKSLLEANRRNQLDAQLSLDVDENYYSSEALSAPRSYLVQGTRVVYAAPGGDDAVVEDAAADVFVEQTLYGVEASFERYGALYSVTIFCADPESDPECAVENRVRALAADMVLATEN